MRSDLLTRLRGHLAWILVANTGHLGVLYLLSLAKDASWDTGLIRNFSQAAAAARRPHPAQSYCWGKGMLCACPNYCALHFYCCARGPDTLTHIPRTLPGFVLDLCCSPACFQLALYSRQDLLSFIFHFQSIIERATF